MTKTNKGKADKARWQCPEVVRLGTIRDIAGPSGFGSQGGPNSKS
ncbi:hypothetical protein [Qipengyuania aquimaris]|nr:hypothetical protein [Qipengyuania aquimaris]